MTRGTCFVCWMCMALPRWLAEPLLWWRRNRKPGWWGLRGPLFRRYWLEES